ncbi:MAG: polysaccharide biosynthesis C-terminal domain-containing protein, partial [Bacteroidales bacterium]|nr:polysaccharide biosynthesis C-terminal domain-containing protein [Bacteroidales bacterium]
IPRFHALGAAISSLISQAFYAITQLVLSRRVLRIPLNGDILIKLAGFLALNMLTGYLTLFIPGWVPGFLILLGSCLVSSLLLGLVRPAELISIIKE